MFFASFLTWFPKLVVLDVVLKHWDQLSSEIGSGETLDPISRYIPPIKRKEWSCSGRIFEIELVLSNSAIVISDPKMKLWSQLPRMKVLC